MWFWLGHIVCVSKHHCLLETIIFYENNALFHSEWRTGKTFNEPHNNHCGNTASFMISSLLSHTYTHTHNRNNQMLSIFAQMKPKNANNTQHWFESAGDFCTCLNRIKSNDPRKKWTENFRVMCASAVQCRNFIWLIFPFKMKICFSNYAPVTDNISAFYMQMKSIKIFAVFFVALENDTDSGDASNPFAEFWSFFRRTANSIYGTLATTKCAQYLNSRPFNLTNCGRAANEVVVCEKV